MKSVRLIKPVIELEEEYSEMLQEWYDSGEEMVPFIIEMDSSDFSYYINQLDQFSIGIGIPANFVPHSTFWLINDDNKISGVVNIRHRLNENLHKRGGHIGYGIRPTERRKGYATKILELALIEAKKLGIYKALVTCDETNIGSVKTILKNKGVFF